MKSLFNTTGFFAFIAMIFLNAFVDLGHKIIIQNTVFKVYDGSTQVILTAIVNGLILIPFILLFTPSGFLADRFRKPKIMRWSAAAAVLVTSLITASYYLGWFEFAFAMTFVLAVQSAFYSPAKYGYIREIAGKNNLATANGVVQSLTIVAILLGMFLFSILFENALSQHAFNNEADIIKAIAPLGWLLVIGSLIELYFAFRLPTLEPTKPVEKFNWKHYCRGQSLVNNTRLLRSDSVIWLSIIGLSLFWGVSQVVLATFPAFAKEMLAIDNTIVIQGLLACSGIGIVAGSLLAGKISNHYIETGLIPIGALGMVVTLFFLPQLSSTTSLSIDILAFGFFGGLFIVPLNSLIQFHARAEQLGTVLAGNNWVQNVVMLTFLIITVLLSIAAVSSQVILNALTVVTLLGAAYTVWKLPQSLVRYVLGVVFAGKYRINVQGFDNMPSQGGVLMLGNHISWLDWAMIQIASPRPVRFVMEKSIYQKWYLKGLLDLFGVIPISGASSKGALQTINSHLKQGDVVCLFPEGSISRSGQLGEFKKGFELCVADVEGVILPFYLRGLWGSRFSRSSSKLQALRYSGLRRDVIVAFGTSLDISTAAAEVKAAVFDLSITTWQTHTEQLPSIAHAWIDRVKQDPSAPCMTDIIGNNTLSRRKALTAALLFARRFGKQSPEKNIGLLLPTSSAGLLANMAAFICGKTVINLNFTSNMQSLLSALNKAEIKTIYTSRRFVSKLEKKGIEVSRLFDHASPIYLEDFQQEISGKEKLLTLLSSYLPTSLLISLYGQAVEITSPAAILFSSGSEGEPKGVVLSHQNIMGNIKQVSDVLDTQDKDVMMASLPLFHAFGLTVTGLMPLIEGIPAICHPDPTDTLNIAKGISQHQATIFCGTSTFLRLFNKNRRIHPLMFDSLRIVIAGAERLNPEIRDDFSLKFGKSIYEGYGTTETTPVATVNIPDRITTDDWHVQTGSKKGTVGLPLPGSSVRIVDPVSLATLASGEDGLILIGGTQVMQGYLNDPEKTAEVIVEIDNLRWYKTGDKGHVDKDGFLIIVDRYSRFAKIGGEMISLGAIESSINATLPEGVEVMTTTVADDKKGEKVVLLYAGDIEQEAIKACIADSGLISLMVPGLLIAVEDIPKLGSGKSDFNTAKKIAADFVAA
ncbi:MAG: acyl-[ACP]--phospholipid O-acyltransferase [Gammaproteobacteria bacterium]|nr:MAG: acyl-[ACP]--phospholipid O-acyltransferase [Gammaproteobacteria bacterium]